MSMRKKPERNKKKGDKAHLKNEDFLNAIKLLSKDEGENYDIGSGIILYIASKSISPA